MQLQGTRRLRVCLGFNVSGGAPLSSGVRPLRHAMKILRTSLLAGLATEFVSALIGLYGAMYSDTLGRIAEVIHTPSMFFSGLLFSQGSRSTIYRDIAFLFVTQWLIYTIVIFAALLVAQVYKHKRDNAA